MDKLKTTGKTGRTMMSNAKQIELNRLTLERTPDGRPSRWAALFSYTEGHYPHCVARVPYISMEKFTANFGNVLLTY